MISILLATSFLYAIGPVQNVFSVGSEKRNTASRLTNNSEPGKGSINNALITRTSTKSETRLYTRKGHFEAQDDPVKLPHTKGKDRSINLVRGDILYARINGDILTYEGAISPVRAIVTDGEFKSSFLIGNSTLDPKSKKMSIRFDSLRPRGSMEVLPVEGYIQSTDGKMGLVGEVESNYWTFFWAQLLSSGVSGYANASRETEGSVLLGSRPKLSTENSAKGAVGEAASVTAEMFRDKSRSAHEVATAKGPHDVQIFIVKSPDDF